MKSYCCYQGVISHAEKLKAPYLVTWSSWSSWRSREARWSL